MIAAANIWHWFGNIDARIWQAFVAGLFLAAGWLVNGHQNRREAANLRSERLRDVHRALYAEIGANLANLGELSQGTARVLTRMENEANYHPFIAREHNAAVFDAIVHDIHILPRTSIDAVVAYYAQVSAVAALTEDLRSETLKSLPQERRMAIYEDYIALREQTVSFGNHALIMIDAYAKGGREGALAKERSLSSLQAAARSDP